MSHSAVLWVLLSATAHVAWNTQLKRARDPQAFSWLLQIVGVPLALLAAVLLRRSFGLPWQGVACACATGVFYGGYYTLIAKSYERGDLSLTYPIIRGVAPVATAVWGIAFFREHPSALGSMGIALICGAVALSAYPEWRASGAKVALAPVALAVAAGLCTSGYSAVDKTGVRFVDPVLYIALCFAAGSVAQGAILFAQKTRREVFAEVGQSTWRLVLCAMLNLGGYLIILFVLKTQPVSYVVPLRSVSVVLSVGAGVVFLGERFTWQRLAAAVLALAGIVSISQG